MGDFGFLIKFEAMDVAETVAKWSGETAGAGGGADDGEVWEVEADGAGGGAFADDDVEFVIFHG